MAAAAKLRVEHVAPTPRGWKVRTVLSGRHRVRIAFPPGARKKGSGKLVEILHPRAENPKAAGCVTPVSAAPLVRKANPGELVIFGNPKRKRARRNAKPKGTSKSTFWMTAKEAEEHLKKLARKPSRPAQGNPRGKRKNPRTSEDLQRGVKVFQIFHGKDPQQVAEQQRSAAMRDTYVALGKLEYIDVVTPKGDLERIDFEGDGVKLASSTEGNQFYFIGGNQRLSDDSLKKLVEDPTKDMLDLGDAVEIQYAASKVHTNFEETSWYHKLGEETGDVPRLGYDRLKKEIFLVGGSYRIDLSVDVSPGIEN